MKEPYQIVAVSDSSGAIYDKNGLDIPFVISHKKEFGTVCNYGNCLNLTDEELFSLDVDILVPAALENAISLKRAKKIKAKIILELANGPITNEAEEYLLKNNAIIIPDVLANAGGVTVSYFEWVQSKSGDIWDSKVVQSKLKSILTRAYYDLDRIQKQYKTDMRKAAYILAISRISRAMELRGIEN